jgi:glycosyltransferase involved in cell wall biosynthesis
MARITFVHPPIDMSGGAKVVCTYAHELAKLGHIVTIVTPRYQERPFGDKLRSLVKGNGWPLRQQLGHLDGKRIKLVTLGSSRPVLENDVPDSDVVIATWWETAEWVNTYPACKGKKFHFIQHHEVPPHFPYLPERSRDVYKLPLNKIVVAKWLHELMATEYGAQSDLVWNTIDRMSYFAPWRDKQSRPTIGLLYSRTGFKGVDTSIAVLRNLSKALPKLRIRSFGSEQQRSDLRLPAGSDFTLLPSQDRIRNIYRSCDLWLTASRSEGFNLPALEAMACRTPVVSTKAGWPWEGVYDGVNGYLSEIDDVHGLTQAALKVLSLSNRDWKQMSEAAYRTLTTPSWEDSAKLFERAIMVA